MKISLKSLAIKDECINWQGTAEEKSLLIGYEVSTVWTEQGCGLSIETEFEQHRRRFSGVLHPETDK